MEEYISKDEMDCFEELNSLKIKYKERKMDVLDLELGDIKTRYLDILARKEGYE